MLVPLGIGYLLGPTALSLMGVQAPSRPAPFSGNFVPPDDPSRPYAFAAWILFSIWWLTVLVRSGRNYVGPAEGPGWEPQTPKCSRCAYIIAGLPLAGVCPECGASVEASLKSLERELRFTRWNAFVLAVRSALRRKGP